MPRGKKLERLRVCVLRAYYMYFSIGDMCVSVPRIEVRKLTTLRRPDGFTQYLLTLPKEYGEALRTEGVKSFYIIYNQALAAFPSNTATIEDLLAFLKAHPELEKLFAKKP